MTSVPAQDVRRPDDEGAVDRSRGTVVLLTIAALVLADVVVAFVDPVGGAVLHGLLLLALLWGWISVGDRALLVLALIPLGRLTSLALTPDSTGAGAYALTGLPLLLAVLWMLGEAVRPRLGRRLRVYWPGVAVALSGVPLGLGLHAVVDLPQAGGLPAALAAPVVFVFAGVLEELLYRGLVQPALTRRLGNVGIVLADLLFVAAYLPTRNIGLILAMALLGLGAGVYVRRTGGLAAVAVAHGLLVAGALVVWPAWG